MIKWAVRILAVGLAILLINAFVIKTNQEKFSPVQWEKTPKRERHVYLEDITKNRLPVGMTIDAVIAMLGDPDFRSKDDSYVTYVVGDSQGMLSFSAITILDIRFNSGRIERVLTRED